MNRQYSKNDIDAALRSASTVLAKPVNAYLIGGCNMTFRNLKASTKDADLLFKDELEEKRIFDALRQTGFSELFPGSYQIDLKAKDILINEQGLQFDLFAKTVMGGLSLTNSMQKRAEKYVSYGKLDVYLTAKEDIYLFKSVTSRPFPRDFEDLLTLQQSGLDWDSIIDEYRLQIKGQPIEKNLKLKLAALKEQGITNPLMKEVTKR